MDTYVKQPNDVLDYDVDLALWFADIPGDDIESVVITVSTSAPEVPTLVIGPDTHPEYVLLGSNPVRFKMWIGGGTNFVDYKVTCLIRTEQDRTKEHEIKIKVRDR
jgi:hypothetical protein